MTETRSLALLLSGTREGVLMWRCLFVIGFCTRDTDVLF